MRRIVFIALRFLRNRKANRGMVPTVLSTLGIGVGTTALIVVLSVMNGFQLGFIEDILEIRSYHIRVQTPSAFDEEMVASMRDLRGVESVVPFKEAQTLAAGRFDAFEPIVVRAVSSSIGSEDPAFASQLGIEDGSLDVSEPGNVVLGSELADRLGVYVGNRVSIMTLAGASFSGLTPVTREFRVAGVFSSGYYEIDTGMAIIPLAGSESVLPEDEPYVYGIKLRNRYNDVSAVRRLTEIVLEAEPPAQDVAITSWREYNSSFFGALRMEKIAMAILLGMIFLVVAVNIAYSLQRSVLEKREDIAVLKAVGTSPSRIRMVFVAEGGLMGVLGGTIGTVFGLLIVVRIDAFFRILEEIVRFLLSIASVVAGVAASGAGELSFFGSTYFYISRVPTRILYADVILIFFFATASSLLAAYWASRRLSEIDPASILRYE